jgi:hypothetical protein
MLSAPVMALTLGGDGGRVEPFIGEFLGFVQEFLMEEQAHLSGRIVQCEYEPRRDALDRLAEAYRRLVPLPGEVRSRTGSVQHPAARSPAGPLLREAVS